MYFNIFLLISLSVCGFSGRQGSTEGRVGQDSDRPKLRELGCGSAAAGGTRGTFESSDHGTSSVSWL